MASAVRLLLRLPPAVRQQVLIQGRCCLPLRPLQNVLKENHQTRSFSVTSALPKNKQGVFKNALPQSRVPQDRRAPSANRLQPSGPSPSKGAPSAAPSLSPVNPATSPKPAPRPSYPDWMSSRFPHANEVLIYVGPSDHGPFYYVSYAIGIFLIIGGVSYAQMFLKDSPEEEGKPSLIIPWYLKTLGAISTVIVVAFGTTFILAPINLIRSITAVRAAEGEAVPWFLRLQVKRKLPFLKPDILETEPKNIFLDRNVPGAVSDLRFHNHPIKDYQSFSERYYAGELVQKEGSALSRISRSMVDIWPGIVKNVRRMFLRDQMAYLRVQGNGNFKLDLQGCHLLEGGKVLEKMSQEDLRDQTGIGGWIKTLIRS